jgi:signal transduction histidine kinase
VRIVTERLPALGLAARRRAFVDGLFFRVVACSFLEIILAVTAILSGLPVATFIPGALVVAAAGMANIPYWYLGRRRGFPVKDFFLHWAADLVGISFLIYSIGGIDVAFGPFIFSMIVITSATFTSRAGGYLVAGGAAFCLVIMSAGIHLGWFSPPAQVWAHHFSLAGEITLIIGAMIFFFMNAYLAGTLSDQLKVAKAHIEEQNKSLEIRVRERTRELEARTTQLEERKDELEEMVHIMTHDLQNVAVASTETTRKLIELDGEQFSARGNRYADRLLRDCRLMGTMLRNLLEAVTASEVAERREVVDVNTVVQEAVARAHGIIDAKGIEVVVASLPPIEAEQQKIYHVFENLLTNACKYVGSNPHPRIEVGGAVTKDSVEYFVRDNGVGVEASQLQRIFQLYHRAPDQLVAGVLQQGHGIGLAVVKRIVQRYGGRIWVDSESGTGATFRLSFPREAAEEEMRIPA